MQSVFQAIVNGVMNAAGYVAESVRTITMGALNTIWGIVKGCTEFIWDHTIIIAMATLTTLLSNLGINIDLDLSAYSTWVEMANYWLPISEAMVLSKALYSFYLYVTAYRWIKWAVPFL